MSALAAVYHQHRGQNRWRDYVPATALLGLGLVALSVATLQPSAAGGQIAVIAPPWYSSAQTVGLIRAAGGSIGGGRAANILFARSNDRHFVSALYAQGAWLVVDLGERGECGEGPQGA